MWGGGVSKWRHLKFFRIKNLFKILNLRKFNEKIKFEIFNELFYYQNLYLWPNFQTPSIPNP